MVPGKTISNTLICCFVLFLSITVIGLIAGCKSRESYKNELEQKGIPYSIESFLDRVAVGNKDTIELFLKAGMDVNARGSNGETALMQAAVNNNVEIVKLLMKKGADVNVKNQKGDTALKYAFLNTRLQELLRKAGAKY